MMYYCNNSWCFTFYEEYMVGDRGGLAIRAFGQCTVGWDRWVKNGPLGWIKKHR